MQVAAFLTCIRHVSRVIWAEHLALAEGFEEDVVDLLKQRSVPCRGRCQYVFNVTSSPAAEAIVDRV